MLKKTLFLVLLLFCQISISQTITAKSWIVTDEKGKLIKGENQKDVRPIASITKLMTAMVVIDAGQNMDEKIGNFTRRQHIQMALVSSNNESSILLCENYPGGRVRCLRDMNSKAETIGMKNTKFVEPSGLSPMNISTAEDLVELVLSASYYPEIILASKTPKIEIKLKKKWFFFKNTNPIIGQKHSFLVSKTGWTIAAGGCIAILVDTEIGKRVVIILGSKNTHTRIPEAELLVKYN